MKTIEQIALEVWNEKYRFSLMANPKDYAADVVAAVDAERGNKHTRWNIEQEGDDLIICKGEHEKSEACAYVRYYPAPQSGEKE